MYAGLCSYCISLFNETWPLYAIYFWYPWQKTKLAIFLNFSTYMYCTFVHVMYAHNWKIQIIKLSLSNGPEWAVQTFRLFVSNVLIGIDALPWLLKYLYMHLVFVPTVAMRHFETIVLGSQWILSTSILAYGWQEGNTWCTVVSSTMPLVCHFGGRHWHENPVSGRNEKRQTIV
jgi:hypothetical protein